MKNIPDHRKWMYNRLLPGRRGYTDEFLAGVEEFDTYACALPVYELTNTIRCLSSKCKNRVHLSADEVRVHLYKKGFEPYYWVWMSHVEPIPTVNEQFLETRNDDNQYETMVFDVGGLSFIPFNVQNNQEEEPHTSAQNFYDLLSTARQPLSPSCVEETELSYALKMMNIKATFNIPQLAMDQIFEYNRHIMGPYNRVPSRYYDLEKLILKLGLAHEKIDCCVNGCMLYYKSDINDRHCKFCGETRFKPRPPTCTRGKKVSKKRIHFLPFIPKLQ